MAYWILQANPARYRVAEALADPSSIHTWTVARYRMMKCAYRGDLRPRPCRAGRGNLMQGLDERTTDYSLPVIQTPNPKLPALSMRNWAMTCGAAGPGSCRSAYKNPP